MPESKVNALLLAVFKVEVCLILAFSHVNPTTSFPFRYSSFFSLSHGDETRGTVHVSKIAFGGHYIGLD